MDFGAVALRMTTSALSLFTRLWAKLSEEPRLLIDAMVTASIIDGRLMAIASTEVLNVGRGDITLDAVEVDWPVGTMNGLVSGEYSDEWTPTGPGAATLPYRLSGKSTQRFEIVNWNAWQHPRLREPRLKVHVIVEAVGKKYRRCVPVNVFDENTPTRGLAANPIDGLHGAQTHPSGTRALVR